MRSWAAARDVNTKSAERIFTYAECRTISRVKMVITSVNVGSIREAFAIQIPEPLQLQDNDRNMATKKPNNIPPEKLELYEKVVATNPAVQRKGAANPYTSLNGHMFSYLNPAGSMALKLPKEEREKFLAKYKTKLFEAYGTVMPEFVTVPDDLLQKTKELQKYFEISYQYVGSLKPKPTTKKKKS